MQGRGDWHCEATKEWAWHNVQRDPDSRNLESFKWVGVWVCGYVASGQDTHCVSLSPEPPRRARVVVCILRPTPPTVTEWCHRLRAKRSLLEGSWSVDGWPQTSLVFKCTKELVFRCLLFVLVCVLCWIPTKCSVEPIWKHKLQFDPHEIPLWPFQKHCRGALFRCNNYPPTHTHRPCHVTRAAK